MSIFSWFAGGATGIKEQPDPPQAGPVRFGLTDEDRHRPSMEKRREFNMFVKSPELAAKPCTLAIVTKMSETMEAEGVGMSPDHFEAARRSLGRGDNIIRFLREENECVNKSSVYHLPTCKSPVANVGFAFHGLPKPRDLDSEAFDRDFGSGW